MAGFSDRANGLAEVALVPHPAVTVLFDLGDNPLVVEDSAGRRQRARIVAGLAPGLRPTQRDRVAFISVSMQASDASIRRSTVSGSNGSPTSATGVGG